MALTAKLVLRSRFVYADGAIREMVLWKLPRPTPERPHGFKYRLHYNSADGRAMVRYDNETGKGDHRQIDGHEEPYNFGVLKSWSMISFETSTRRARVETHEKTPVSRHQGSP